MASFLQVNNIGTALRVTIMEDGAASNISAATTKQFIFSKPDGTSLTVTASFYTTGADGILTYAFVSGDLNVAGVWRYQVYLVIGSSQYRTDVGEFYVHSNI
jgi:hypothetical protein